jgi:hypothetical protein
MFSALPPQSRHPGQYAVQHLADITVRLWATRSIGIANVIETKDKAGPPSSGFFLYAQQRIHPSFGFRHLCKNCLDLSELRIVIGVSMSSIAGSKRLSWQ